MNLRHFCVIMAGNGQSFLRATYNRYLKIVPPENILVVTLEASRDAVRAELPELPDENLLLEPISRGTAPCMTYAVYTILQRCPDAIIVATPSDHVIQDEKLYISTVNEAIAYVSEHDVLMTIGLLPAYPDANFGYIQVREGKLAWKLRRPLEVKTFTEKPSVELARIFIKTGEFFWNSGIFVWRARTIREELEFYLPEVTELFGGWETRLQDPQFIQHAYSECPRISLDNGIMERTGRAWLYPARFGWEDHGRDKVSVSDQPDVLKA